MAPKTGKSKNKSAAKSYHAPSTNKRSDTTQTIVPHKCTYCGENKELRGDELLSHTNKCRKEFFDNAAKRQLELKKLEEKKKEKKGKEKPVEKGENEKDHGKEVVN